MPCEDGEPTGECDTSNNENYKCPACIGLLDDCANYTSRAYYGNDVRYCYVLGCPGDCVQQDAVECYVVYTCKLGAILSHSCQGDPVKCLPDVGGMCYGCAGNPDEWEPIQYRYPTECQ